MARRKGGGQGRGRREVGGGRRGGDGGASGRNRVRSWGEEGMGGRRKEGGVTRHIAGGRRHHREAWMGGCWGSRRARLRAWSRDRLVFFEKKKKSYVCFFF